jgi:hypothetical protein
MEERNGLWHASNSILMPPTSEGPTKRNVGTSSSPRINKFTAPAQSTKQPNDTASPDPKPDDDIDAEQFYQTHPTRTTELTKNEISVQNMGVFGGNMSKALKQLELWHQRTGHLAPEPFDAPSNMSTACHHYQTRRHSSNASSATWQNNVSRTGEPQSHLKISNPEQHTMWTWDSSEVQTTSQT